MKRVINGKIYNTSTATEVASFSNGFYGNDFRNMEETLYKTKKGAWFLAGEGGPMSKYSQPCGNMTGGGKGMEVLTADEALEWLEEKEETAAIEEHFKGRIEEA